MTADRLEDAAVDTLNVEFVAIAVFSAAPAIADGEIASSPEPWDNNMGESFPKPLAEDKAVDLGEVGADAREGWVETPGGLVNKYGWPGMFDEWPVGSRFIQNFRIDNNPDKWRPFVDAAMAGS